MKKILLLGVALSVLFSACSQKPKQAKLEDKFNSDNPIQEETSNPDEEEVGDVKGLGDYMVETTAAQKTPAHILYDPSKGKLMCIVGDYTNAGSAADSTVHYSLKQLNEKNEWVDEMSWSIQEDGILMNCFTYSIEGDLYAIGEKNTDSQDEKKGDDVIQTYHENFLYQIQEGGGLKKIALENLNETIKTEYDKEQEEKSRIEHREEKIADMDIKTTIAGMNVFQDGTATILYGNETLKIYNLTDGTVMQTIVMEDPSGYNDSSFIVTQDEIIAGSLMNILENDTIDVLDKDTGEWKREIKIEGESKINEMGSAGKEGESNYNEIESGVKKEDINYDAMPSLSLGTMNDIYLFRVNDGIYGGGMNEDLEMIVDSSVLNLKREYLYPRIIRGINNDFYITYFNRITQEDAAIHCYPNE